LIGVIAPSSQHEDVLEFFELFKTRWEFFSPTGYYEVLLCSGKSPINVPIGVKLVVVYSASLLVSDVDGIKSTPPDDCNGRLYRCCKSCIPIYGESVTFTATKSSELQQIDEKRTLIKLRTWNDSIYARIGYDLFGELHKLLAEGQPAIRAAIPTAELHIALFRQLVLYSGAGLIEIPPIPDSYAFTACLTHDIDQPSLRMHKFDHTMLGFLCRALVVTSIDVLRGRRSIHELWQNWRSALSLPFVHLGWISDPWLRFDQYFAIEGNARSTFYVIPQKGNPGQCNGKVAPKMRAAPYAVTDIADPLRTLASNGCEIALHGIDAWWDEKLAREEIHVLGDLATNYPIGVRMHWLYFDKHTFEILEKVGIDYDSTMGYNETVGFRSGTMQVYSPAGVHRLMELPLHIMDTALFMASHLNLSANEARKHVDALLDLVNCFGGVITINWHDRSISPERLWKVYYTNLLDELRRRKAWLTSAANVVAWFRSRRSAQFEHIYWEEQGVRLRINATTADYLPGLVLHIYMRRKSIIDFAEAASIEPIRLSLQTNKEMRYSLS
jgi:hypothetical protein